MSAMPDSTRRAELDAQTEYVNEAQVWKSCEPEAIERVKIAYLDKPLNWDDLMEEMGETPDHLRRSLIEAMRIPDFAEIGSQMFAMQERYRLRTMDAYLQDEMTGGNEVAKQVWIIHEENRG